MAKAVRIADLEASVRWQADIADEAELRNPSASLRVEIDRSIRHSREKICDGGHPYFLVSKTLTMPEGPAAAPDGTKFCWGLIKTESFEPEIVRIYGVEIHFNDATRPLQAVEFGQRNDYGKHPGMPCAWFGKNETDICILPPPDAERKCTIWYLPATADLLADDDEFNPGLPGGEQWVIWDMKVKLLDRENYPDQYAVAVSERERAWLDIQSRASAHQRSDAVIRQDTRGKRRYRYRTYPWEA
jgi:hypothetical protein